jgi:hypothetical protein
MVLSSLRKAIRYKATVGPLLLRSMRSNAEFRWQRARAMTEPLALTTERIDYLPLLLAQLERMRLQPLLDEHFPTYGNWVGPSLGWVSMLWLTHLLS